MGETRERDENDNTIFVHILDTVVLSSFIHNQDKYGERRWLERAIHKFPNLIHNSASSDGSLGREICSILPWWPNRRIALSIICTNSIIMDDDIQLAGTYHVLGACKAVTTVRGTVRRISGV